MEAINNYIETRKNKYLEWFIFLIFGILTCLIDEAFNFNPFILPVIYFSYQRGINTYLITITGMLFVGFFTSIPYGIEISLIQVVFFILSFVCYFINNEFIKKYGAFIFTHLTFDILFLIRFFSFTNVLNVLLMIAISFGILYAYQNLIDCIYNKDREFNSLCKVIVLSTISILSFGINFIYIFVIRLIHLISSKCVSNVDSILAIIINCYIIYTFQNASEAIVISLLTSGIIASIINKQYSQYAYLISFIVIGIYFFEDFYLNRYFYQGILAVIIFFFIPSKWLDFIESLFSRDESKMIIETNNKLLETKKTIGDIVSYFDLLMNSPLDNNVSPEEKMVAVIKEKVCESCPKNKQCNLESIIRMSLERELSKEERSLLFEECVSPYKILSNVRIKRTSLDNEKKYLNELQTRNLIHRQEMQMIYTPLRNVFVKTNILKDKKKMLQEALNSQFNAKEISIFDTKIRFKISLEKDESINEAINLVSKTFNKTYYLEDMFYIFSRKEYDVTLSCEDNFKIEQAILSDGVNKKINGDSYLSFSDDNHHYLMLSDGIGHNKESSNISLFLIQSLNAYKKIETSLIKQIENSNILLKSNVDEERYATLDYVDIDLVKGEMEMFKCGSFYSFLYREGKLIKFKSNSPPIGILLEIKTSSLKKELLHDDILIFLTDGYVDTPEKIIEETMVKAREYNVVKICEELNASLRKNSDIKDAKTIIVLKVIDMRK